MPDTSADDDAAIREVLRGAPSWITEEIAQDTLRTFRPYYGPGMTPEDALEILLNVGNLFTILEEKPNPRPAVSPASTGASRPSRRRRSR